MYTRSQLFLSYIIYIVTSHPWSKLSYFGLLAWRVQYFPDSGDANPRNGTNLFAQNFLKNCMQLNEMGGGSLMLPLDLPVGCKVWKFLSMVIVAWHRCNAFLNGVHKPKSFTGDLTQKSVSSQFMAVVNQMMKREFSNAVSVYKIPGTAVQCNGAISQIRFDSNSR